jgi:hypothetical protein
MSPAVKRAVSKARQVVRDCNDKLKWKDKVTVTLEPRDETLGKAGQAEAGRTFVDDVITDCEDRASRHLSLDRTTDLKGVVAWLLSRTFDEKLAALALSELAVDDIQTNIQRNGFYDGLIGDDLERAWEAEVATALEGDEATSGISAESRLVANFIKGLRANV